MRKLVFALALLISASRIPAQGTGGQTSTGGNILATSANCATAQSCVVMGTVPPTTTSISVTVTPVVSFSGTLIAEVSTDGGFTWSTAPGTFNATGLSVLPISAVTSFRVRCSAYTSGNAGVQIVAAGNQINVSSGGGSGNGGNGPAGVGVGSSIFAISNSACNGAANCLQWVDDDATDNCGAATTAFLSSINAYAGPGRAQLTISGSGTGKAYLLKTCSLTFTAPANVTCKATIDAGSNSGASLIVINVGSTFPGTLNWDGCIFVGGGSLTTAGIEIKNAVGNTMLTNINWRNFGAGNATLGSCTNYAIKFDDFPYEGTVSQNFWSNDDATTGRCFGYNATTTSGEGTIYWVNNTVGGKNGSVCASQGIIEGGWYGDVIGNNIGNIAVPIRVQGSGHRISQNQLDTEGCTTGAGVNALIQYGANGSTSQNVSSVLVEGNVAQFGALHANALIQAAGDATTPTLTEWIVNSNMQSGTAGNAILVNTTTGCTQISLLVGGCVARDNQGITPPIACNTTNPGWNVNGNLAQCVSSAQTANVAASNLIPSATMINNAPAYFTCTVILTTAATTSSTLPQCEIVYTDAVSSVTQTVLVTPAWASGAVNSSGTTTNTVGNSVTGSSGRLVLKSGVAPQYATVNYASTGATAMQYLVIAELHQTQ